MMKLTLVTLSFILLLTACGKRESFNSLSEPSTRIDSNKNYIDEKASFFAIGQKTLRDKLNQQTMQVVSEDKAKSYLNSLAVKKVTQLLPASANPFMTVGIPVHMLKEQYLFGGVITKVSDRENEDLGVLKLTDLEPVHVDLNVVKADADRYGVLLSGCLKNCSEKTKKRDIVAIPIVAVDVKNETLVLDVAALAKGLNLVEILDPRGDYTQLKTKDSKVTLVDYSYSTLVFDVEANMIPLRPVEGETREVSFTTRWFLRLSSFVHADFTSREAREGVGFFMTSRSAEPKIKRFALPDETRRVHYYVKNVPEEYRAAFASAFDRWNVVFKDISGQPLLTYEFVSANDPRASQLTTGDIRYNIVEWDLINNAPYGGLGPSISHEFTGENLSANVLVQGPRVIELYSAWFKVSAQAAELNREGRTQEADALLVRFRRAHPIISRKPRNFRLNLGELDFNIRAQETPYEDPIASREDFDEIPIGYSFQKYMNGYFHEMIAHELGHNLGLRHNFKGNFGYDESQKIVSNSVMEYMGRLFRHVNDVGEYDIMAIEYGYTGTEPKRANLFCTDEETVQGGGFGLQGNPECSRDDATQDPFSYEASIVAKGVNHLLAKNSIEASSWTVKDLQNEVGGAIVEMGFYGAMADKSDSWEYFFRDESRPRDPAKLKEYVGQQVHKLICNKDIALAISKKVGETAKTDTIKKMEDLRSLAKVIFKNLGSLPLPEFKDCDVVP